MIFPAEEFSLHMADPHAANAPYIALGGLRIRNLRLRASPLNREDTASAWQHLAASSARVRMEIDGSGIFTATASDVLLAQVFLAKTAAACRLTMPHFGNFSGPFFITELAYEARHEDEMRWRLGLQSAADIEFSQAQKNPAHD